MQFSEDISSKIRNFDALVDTEKGYVEMIIILAMIKTAVSDSDTFDC